MQHAPMSRARYMQENRKMRFTEALEGWTQGRLTQAEAALLLGQCERSFRRHIERYQADGLDGLLDKRLSQISKRRASDAEVDHVVARVGSDELGLDPMGLNETDTFLVLQAKDTWRGSKEDIIAALREVLEGFPGLVYGFTQPIEMRISEMLTGTRGDGRAAARAATTTPSASDAAAALAPS